MSVRRWMSSSRFGEKGMAARIRCGAHGDQQIRSSPTSFRGPAAEDLLGRDLFQHGRIELPPDEVGTRFEMRDDQNGAGGFGIDAERAEERSEEHTSELQSQFHLVC